MKDYKAVISVLIIASSIVRQRLSSAAQSKMPRWISCMG